jgi:hypothetical protein
MSRHTNEFELLLTDVSNKKEFLELVSQHKTIKSLWRHLKNEGFKGYQFYWGYQVLGNLMRRLDLGVRSKGKRGRINLFLKELHNNPQMKKDFIQLVQSQKSKSRTSKYLREGYFYNEKHFVSGQTIGNMMRSLGYVGRCGKPAIKSDSKAKELPRWLYGEPGMN